LSVWEEAWQILVSGGWTRLRKNEEKRRFDPKNNESSEVAFAALQLYTLSQILCQTNLR
jgi:hypothetical protein